MDSSDQFNTTWRKVASTIYQKPVDSKIFGGVEFDVTELEKYISQKRREGLKITLTHFFVLVLSKALQIEVPEFNTYVRRGKIVLRPTIDAGVSILQSNGDMTTIIIPNADTHTFSSLESAMNDEIVKTRKGQENSTTENKSFIAKIPWPLRNWIFAIYRTLTIKWGLSMPVLGLSANSFGSFAVTNIGSLGLDYGFPALLPTSNVAFVLVMGGVQKKPVVVNDEVVIRRMMAVTIVFDHRIADASHGAKLFKYIKHAVRRPEMFE